MHRQSNSYQIIAHNSSFFLGIKIDKIFLISVEIFLTWLYLKYAILH